MNHEDVDLCQPEGSFIDILDDWDKSIKKATNKCPNRPKCKRGLYSMTSEKIPGKIAGEYRARIRIELANSAVQFIEDSYYYDAQSLIGEVGGTMGLLLGLSFLSFFDLIDYLLSLFEL